MRKKNYKGRCEKKSVPKCNEIFKAYDAIQNQCHLVKLIGSNQFKPLTKKFKIVVDIATKMCGRSRY